MFSLFKNRVLTEAEAREQIEAQLAVEHEARVEAEREAREAQKEASGGLSLGKLLFLIVAFIGMLRLLRANAAVSFRGRTALITGGSRGLGLEMARQLADEGAKLVLVARDEDDLRRAKSELEARGARVLTIARDITEPNAARDIVEQTIREFNTLDLLINNAGVIQVGPVEHMTDHEWELDLDLHTRAPLRLMREAAPYVIKSGAGRIVNIASFGGLVAVPHMAPYSTSKFALVGLSDAMRHELWKDGVRVTTVCPGTVRSGSHVAAKFKGRQALEYKMFKLGAAVGVPVEKAAELILDAARHGDPHLTFPLPIAWAGILYRLFPNFAGLVLGLAGRFMPPPTDDTSGDELIAGRELEDDVSDTPLDAPADAATQSHNQLDGVPKSEALR